MRAADALFIERDAVEDDMVQSVSYVTTFRDVPQSQVHALAMQLRTACVVSAATNDGGVTWTLTQTVHLPALRTRSAIAGD